MLHSTLGKHFGIQKHGRLIFQGQQAEINPISTFLWLDNIIFVIRHYNRCDHVQQYYNNFVLHQVSLAFLFFYYYLLLKSWKK
jgi:hypothetical protein